ncbi:acyl-CoA dehydrogenase [Mycobacterium sp. 852002-53434_SCH5985345]|uniref:acyl-CoA dehydrogenase family protein n=1 Tax=Mycobacterium sp. 852002-53434_SCH5985345 TaxID=1834107 RepID=UPI0008021058|nr:acyl-CoA dehydrogenase family protein [Mycobacterium sp. 852002-53434_SCH5985345]OBF49062.1 acyl-CoA dehydrogenase [Mycobacterium sp. 852002-53434_SCH5985345]
MADDDIDLDLLRAGARDFLTGRRAQDSVKELAAMDWTGLLVEENLGGSGWRPVETTVIAEELGRAHNSSTWFGSVLSAAALASAPGEVRDRWLPAMLDGTATAGCAQSADTVRVARGDAIDILVTLEHNGIHLFELAETIPRSRDDELLDLDRAAWRVEAGGADSVLIGGPQRAAQLLAVARVLLGADSLGAFSSTFERLVGYLKERIAFGAPIASFQVVQHRLVDLLVFEAKARAIVMKACRALEADENLDVAITLSAAAHAFVAAKATAAVDECMQLSGGIGFTWEYPLHRELRRVFTNGYLLGTARSSRALFAQRSGW